MVVPASVHDVLHTLVFVVADELRTGETHLLWDTRGAQVGIVPARPQGQQPERENTLNVVDLVIYTVLL